MQQEPHTRADVSESPLRRFADQHLCGINILILYNYMDEDICV